MAEVIEAALLRFSIGLRRSCGLGLESFVHAFMGAVLFGVRGGDALVVDAQAGPPDRQAREAVEAGAGKRGAVVGAGTNFGVVGVAYGRLPVRRAEVL